MIVLYNISLLPIYLISVLSIDHQDFRNLLPRMSRRISRTIRDSKLNSDKNEFQF